MSLVELPPGSCDCHAHVFGPFDQFPLTADRFYTPPAATSAQYLAMLDALGLARGVLVQPTANGWDHRATLAALRAGGDCLRGIAVPHPDTPDAELVAMQTAGIRGIRFNQVDGGATAAGRSGTLAFDRLPAFASRLRSLGWHAQLFAVCGFIAGQAPALARLQLPLVIDHLCRVDVERGVADAGFQTVLSLVREGLAAVKLTAYRCSANVPGYADVRPFHDALVAANPRQLLWGSDWPFVNLPANMKPTAEGVTRVFCDWVADPELRRQILVDNPARIYGFD